MEAWRDELYHYGILGQKWGVRRYQNEDGSLTAAGRRRYGKGEKMNENDQRDSSVTRRVKKDYNNLSDKDFFRKYQASKNTYRKRVNKYGDPYTKSPLAKRGKELERKNKDLDNLRKKKALKIGAAAVAGALAAYSGYTLYKAVQSRKAQPFTPEQLRAMGIKVFEPIRMDIPTTDLGDFFQKIK